MRTPIQAHSLVRNSPTAGRGEAALLAARIAPSDLDFCAAKTGIPRSPGACWPIYKSRGHDLSDLLLRARRLALRWCRAAADADDIAQEAVLRFLAAAPCPDNPTAWLFVVIRRMCTRERERDLRRGDAEAAFESLRPAQHESGLLLAIEQVLDSLTERDRGLILLVIEGRDSREIARRFRCNIRDVGQMVARVRKRARTIRDGTAVRKRTPRVSSVSRRNNMSNIASLTKLPAPSLPPPTLASGTVSLFPDDNWNNGFVVSTDDFRDSVRHAFDGTPIQDAATYVAFNLPVGTVLTLLENVAPTNGQVWNLRDCGRCVDLVGTGTTEAVDLSAVNMNDCLSAFFWRRVDFNLGAIELFDDANFGGNRSTIFLGEWPSATVQSIDGWWLQDAVSSVRWWMLNDRQTASLFENGDGTGDRSYHNIKGWGETKEIASLGDVGFNDCVSSFRWDGLKPRKEIIAPFALDVEIDASNSTALQSQVIGVNDSTLAQPVTVTLNDASSQTLTVTTTETLVAGVKVTAETNWSVGTDVTGKSGGKLSVELSYSYTDSETTTTSTTRTVALAISQVVNAPPKTHYVATLVAQIGKLPPTSFNTTAQRWYDQPVTGGVPDPANNGWFKRVEPVTGTVEGGLACRVSVSIHATPLP